MIYSQNAEDAANEKKYAPLIAQTEAANGIPAGLLHRQLYEESHYRADIISGATPSSVGALGIAQFMPDTARSLGIDPTDPLQAIPAAGRYMKSLYNDTRSWSMALAAYNWGIGNVLAYIRTGLGAHGQSMPSQTNAYVADITGALPGVA